MVVMEASVAQRKANLFRHGVPPGAPAAEGEQRLRRGATVRHGLL